MFVMSAAVTVAFKTWYVRRAATADGLVASAIPALELVKAPNAALFGARMVMF